MSLLGKLKEKANGLTRRVFGERPPDLTVGEEVTDATYVPDAVPAQAKLATPASEDVELSFVLNNLELEIEQLKRDYRRHKEYSLASYNSESSKKEHAEMADTLEWELRIKAHEYKTIQKKLEPYLLGQADLDREQRKINEDYVQTISKLGRQASDGQITPVQRAEIAERAEAEALAKTAKNRADQREEAAHLYYGPPSDTSYTDRQTELLRAFVQGELEPVEAGGPPLDRGPAGAGGPPADLSIYRGPAGAGGPPAPAWFSPTKKDRDMLEASVYPEGASEPGGARQSDIPEASVYNPGGATLAEAIALDRKGATRPNGPNDNWFYGTKPPAGGKKSKRNTRKRKIQKRKSRR